MSDTKSQEAVACLKSPDALAKALAKAKRQASAALLASGEDFDAAVDVALPDAKEPSEP